MAAILNHTVTGKDKHLALLLIHPLGAELGFWDDFIAAVGSRFTSIACDLRSAGKSPRASGVPSLFDHARDLEALREANGIEKLVPVGCAVGSMIAASYAAVYPDAVAALILPNPTPRSSEQAKAMLTERAALVRRDGMKAILPGAVERPFLNQPRDERYWRYYEMFAAQDADAYAISALSAADSDASEALKSLTCRTLLVAGRHDALLPLDHADAVHRLVPQSELMVMEDAAHFVPYQRPDPFAQQVDRFLAAGR